MPGDTAGKVRAQSEFEEPEADLTYRPLPAKQP